MWIEQLQNDNRLEQIPFLSVDDIDYFIGKGFKTIKDIINNIEKIREDMPEGLKDKYDDIIIWIKSKQNDSFMCNNKYYLN